MSEEENRILNDQSEFEISKEIYKICERDIYTVFPVGFRAAGKTMFLSSIFWYSEKHATKPFTVNPFSEYPFNNGLKERDAMVTNFDVESGKMMDRNAVGTMNLFGMSLEPKNKNLAPIKLNFIDISGEDIAKIQVAQDAQLTGKLRAVFDALQLNSSPVAFLLITPFTTNEENGDSAEDTLQCNFINYLKTNYSRLYDISKLYVIVSKWDQNNDPNYSVEAFIKEKRPSVYSLINGTNAIYGAYSIGTVLELKESNEVTHAKLMKINEDYPWRFWNKLYEMTTGKSLIHKTWWQRLFS